MRVVAVVLVLACGCTQMQARKVHRAGEITTAGALVGVLICGVTASVVPSHDDQIIRAGIGFVPLSLLGALLYIATDGKANQETAAPPVSRRDRNRAVAWQLTQKAADAARSEDCTQVQAIAPRVRDLDVELHLAVFLRDAAIQRCLRPAE